MRHTIILLALICTACSSSLPSIRPYRMEIQQGNVVTSKMMLQLRPGMNKSQVKFVMGTPLIQDSFHKDRWDYFYQLRKDGRIVEQRRVILEFDGDALKRVRGDVVPADRGEAVAATPTPEAPAKVEEKKGLDKLKFWEKNQQPETAPQAAPKELVNPDLVNPPAAATAKAQQPKAEVAPVVVPPVESGSAAVSTAPLAAPVEVPKPVAPSAKSAAPIVAPVESKSLPAVEPKPAAAVEAESKPVATQSKPAAAPAKPEQDLPPEGEPGYFERMLEKIGF
ncbi:outer membrane protein assembly factor BamE [Methyloradius palustris]|nr:outer membrane protein assembly factor BamE [Methyloradius palustris]